LTQRRAEARLECRKVSAPTPARSLKSKDHGPAMWRSVATRLCHSVCQPLVLLTAPATIICPFSKPLEAHVHAHSRAAPTAPQSKLAASRLHIRSYIQLVVIETGVIRRILLILIENNLRGVKCWVPLQCGLAVTAWGCFTLLAIKKVFPKILSSPRFRSSWWMVPSWNQSRPAITVIALLYVIAFWAIFTGIFEIIAKHMHITARSS